MSEPIQNCINGVWKPATSGKTIADVNPADHRDVIGNIPASGADDVHEAVLAARSAFQAWSSTPAPARGDILRHLGDLLTERKAELARLMTREMGKPFFETKGDVQEAIDTAYYAATETRRLFGHTVPSELPNKFNMSIRRPIGVVGVITAWNFPVAVPTWKMFPALAAGNTVVFKPSEDAPASGQMLIKIMHDAGIPTGVLNLVHGAGVAGAALVEHPDVDAISFTGSTETGCAIAARCGALNKRVSLEMGGKNPAIVLADANVDLVVEGLVWGAFGTTGQRCTATSRLIVHESLHDEIVEKLTARAQALKLGYGNEDGVDMGPVINQKGLDKIASYIEIAKGEGAQVHTGGEQATEGDLAHGTFFKPTILTGVTRDMRVAREEIFGPVLSVIKISDYDEAISVANDIPYGLSSAIYTQDVSVAFRAMHDIQAGITYVNGPTIGAEAHMPFGGVKGTGNGHREGGWEVFDFYTETKTVYVDYSGRLQKAQIDNVAD